MASRFLITAGAVTCFVMIRTAAAFTLKSPISNGRCSSLMLDRIDARCTTFEGTARSNQVLCMAAIDDDISLQLSKAKALIAKAKAKIAAQEKVEKNSDGVSTIQNMDSTSENSKENDMAEKRSQVVNSESDSGLITTDGERMLSLAEEEEWEARNVMELFEREVQENEVERQKINVERDIAKNMFGLRKHLFNADYEKVFDKRNPRIGDI